MASTTWFIQAVDTQGADLVLSRIVPWGADGELTPASITTNLPPVSGVVENLLVDDAAQCVFAAADVAASSFRITVTFAAPVDLWGFRFAGSSAITWPLRHQVGSGNLVESVLSTPFVAAGVLSAAPSREVLLGFNTTEWVGSTPPLGVANTWNKIALSQDGRTVFATNNGAPILSKDGGLTWVIQTSIPNNNGRKCCISADGQVLFTSGSGDTPRLSVDGGLTWVIQSTLTGMGANSAMSADGAVILVASSFSGPISATRNRGLTWETITSLGNSSWSDVAVSGDGLVWVVSPAGSSQPKISRDGGITWETLSSFQSASWSFAASHDGAVLIAGMPNAGTGNRLAVSTDSGQTWVYKQDVGDAPIGPVAASSSGEVLLAARSSSGYPWLSLDKGVTWREQTAAYPTARSWSTAALSGDGAVGCVAGTSITPIFRYFPDKIYQNPPLQLAADKTHVFLESEPVAQGVGDFNQLLAKQTLDFEHGGYARIYGKVERKNTPLNVPLVRRVRLHRSKDGMLIRETWSKPDGSYEFRDISANWEYDVIAWDHEMNYRSVVANNLKAEV